jgi:hypothetical protein
VKIFGEKEGKIYFLGMPSSDMLHFVALVRTDVSEERITYTIKGAIIGELGIMLAITSNRSTL